MTKLEFMPNLIEHENNGCQDVQRIEVDDAKNEVESLKKKIVELEENLGKEKELLATLINDKDEIIKVQNDKIVEVESAFEEVKEMMSQATSRPIPTEPSTTENHKSSPSGTWWLVYCATLVIMLRTYSCSSKKIGNFF